MRNGKAISIGLLLVLLSVSACRNERANTQQRMELQAGYDALERNPDEAISRANAYLAKSRGGPGSADALYLRGRGFEQKATIDADRAPSHLQAARESYEQALRHRPQRNLEAHIRAGVANVAYFQEDFVNAMAQWRAAYDGLEDANAQAWSLYRSGLCQQRVNRFEEADKTFQLVQQRHPNTEPARRAREHQGARSFLVQLGTFDQPASADQLMNRLRADGLTPSKTTDSQGRTVVSVANLPNFQAAKQIKMRMAQQHPDAMIFP